jgi:hypothetical protein
MPASRRGSAGAPRKCPACNQPHYRPAPAKTCGRIRCPAHLDLYLGDQRMRVIHNALVAGQVVMLTQTAPGVDDGLPWDPGYCTHRADSPRPCSGPRGCRVSDADARSWNDSAPARRSRWHQAARQAVYRELGPNALKVWISCPELQTRGLLHWHVLLGFATPLQRKAARRYVAHLNRTRRKYWFGFVDRKPVASTVVGEAAIAATAKYLLKYMTKGTAGGLSEMIARNALPSRAVYVHRELTRETRCTARNLRRRRAIFMATGVTYSSCRDVEVIWAACTAFDLPLTALEIGDLVDDANAPPAE